MIRKANREAELENNLRINHKRVHRSKKTYNRKSFKLNTND